MDALDVTEEQAISCVELSEGRTFIFFSRNWKIVLVELLRRSLVLSYTTLDLHVTAFSHLVRNDDKVRIYTDGSLLQIDHMVYMVAGAVLVYPTREQEFTYCARIDPIDINTHGKAPGTTKPETVALTLGFYSALLYGRRCDIITDNQALCDIVRTRKRWPLLREFRQDRRFGGTTIGARSFREHSMDTIPPASNS